jgi:hypothetical protein
LAVDTELTAQDTARAAETAWAAAHKPLAVGIEWVKNQASAIAAEQAARHKANFHKAGKLVETSRLRSFA